MNSVPLGELVTILGGGTPDKSVPAYWDGDVPWASVKDFKSTELESTIDRISDAGVANSATNIIPAGSVIVPTRMAVGKAAINTIDLAINQDLKALIPGPRVDRRYLLHCLLVNGPQLERHATGATVKGITLDVLKALRIPLPPLDQQRRVAAILDQADTLRRKRREMIKQLDNLRIATFTDIFVNNSATAWPIRTVADISADIRTGPFGSQLLHSEFVDAGVAVLGIDNTVKNRFQWDERRFITPEKYQHLRRYTVRPRDVLITIMGTCGRCAVVPDDIPIAINTKHLCCITVKTSEVLPEFLHAAFLQHPAVLRQMGIQTKGAVMPGLNMGIIKSIALPIPPIDVQEAFKIGLDTASKVQVSAENQAKILDTLFASLQHHAFRGEL